MNGSLDSNYETIPEIYTNPDALNNERDSLDDQFIRYNDSMSTTSTVIISNKRCEVYDDDNNYTDETFRNGQNEKEAVASYFGLLQNYDCFRLYLVSFIITHIGEWLTYIASITLIEEILGEDNRETSRSAIGILVVVRLIPDVLVSPIGGVIADSYDRRITMIILDITGSFIVLLFIIAKHTKSIPLIYLVTFLQEIVAGLYEPCRASIVPMLVPDEEYQKKAYTVNGIVWSLMAAIGSAAGGLIVSYLGFDQCFLLDSFTYLSSAFFMWLIHGSWNAAEKNIDPQELCNSSSNAHNNNESQIKRIWNQMTGMTIDGINYLRCSFFGALVLLKCTAAIIYGVTDVLNVSFSEEAGIIDDNYYGESNYDKTKSSARLGYIFASVGVGCLIGPVLSEPFVRMDQPYTIQIACIISLATASIGCIGMGLFASKFYNVILFTCLRSMGSSCNWINSTLLIQKFSTIDMLGRVSSIDYALALLMEAFMAYMCGILQDKAGLSARDVAIMVGLIGLIFTVLWAIYHLYGMGAANIDAVKEHHKQQQEQRQQMQEGTENDGENIEKENVNANDSPSTTSTVKTETSSLL